MKKPLLTNSNDTRVQINVTVVDHGSVDVALHVVGPDLCTRWIVCVQAKCRARVVAGLVSANYTEVV